MLFRQMAETMVELVPMLRVRPDFHPVLLVLFRALWIELFRQPISAYNVWWQ